MALQRPNQDDNNTSSTAPPPEESDPTKLDLPYVGAFKLAVVSYILYGLYPFIFNPRGITTLLRDLAIETLAYQPSMQLFWSAAAQRIEDGDWPPWIRTCFLNTLFINFVCLSVMGYFSDEFLVAEPIAIGTLFALYAGTSGWIALESWLERNRYSLKTRQKLGCCFPSPLLLALWEAVAGDSFGRPSSTYGL